MCWRCGGYADVMELCRCGGDVNVLDMLCGEDVDVAMSM